MNFYPSDSDTVYVCSPEAKVAIAIAEHQEAFLQTYSRLPTVIYVNPTLICVLVDSPERDHFDLNHYFAAGEVQYAGSWLKPDYRLAESVMRSPLKTALA